MKPDFKSFFIGAILTVFVVAGAAGAIYTAWRMGQPGPVSPTVPQSKPQAAEPGSTSACTLVFTVGELPLPECENVTMSPNNQALTSVSQTRSLTATASGGTQPFAYTWTASGGTLSSSTGRTVTWTSPSTSSGNNSWTISATVTDANGKTDTSDSCRVTLNYSASCNSNCTQSSDCPNDMVCSNGKCRNSECVTDSDCVCPPPKKVCNDTCTVNSECESQYICAGGNCRNPSCITQPSCVCPLPTPPPPPITYVPTPTPTPTPRCNSVCTNSGQCPSTMDCVDGRCRNPSCPTDTDCVCPKPVQTHLACSTSHTCITVNGAGVDTCTSDASCQPIATPVPIPESGVGLPTIAIILGGMVLLTIGILAL